MHQRIEVVEKAYAQTFEWIFVPDSAPPTKSMRKASKVFTDWLSHGDGIFHLVGKLGSGKSTLMKFLYHHPETKAKLCHWAGMFSISL